MSGTSFPLYFLALVYQLPSSSFRQIPTFGKDTIRKFSNNVSETKQLAARDYEDILQVCFTHSSLN